MDDTALSRNCPAETGAENFGWSQQTRVCIYDFSIVKQIEFWDIIRQFDVSIKKRFDGSDICPVTIKLITSDFSTRLEV